MEILTFNFNGKKWEIELEILDRGSIIGWFVWKKSYVDNKKGIWYFQLNCIGSSRISFHRIHKYI